MCIRDSNRGGQGKGGSGSGKGTGGSRGRSNNTRGGQAKANRNQNKKARRTVKSIANSRVGKAIGNAFKGAAAKASTLSGNQKPQSKLQQQFSNFKKRWQALSTPEAKRQRRYDRLRNQFGLDYDRMNKSFAVDVNVDRAMKHYKVPNFIRNITPGFIKNIKLKKQFYSPTKLGAADGWTRKTANRNQSPNSIRSATPAVRNTMYEGPKDTLSAMYQNLLGRDIGQEGLDYWTDELESGRQTEDQVRANILRGAEFQGRSEEDRSAALLSLKERRAQQGYQQGPQPIPGIDWQEYRRPRQLPGRYYLPGYPSSKDTKGKGGGSPFGIAAALAAQGVLRGSGLRARAAKNAKNQNNKVANTAAKSIAAHIAAMGGF